MEKKGDSPRRIPAMITFNHFGWFRVQILKHGQHLLNKSIRIAGIM